MIRMKRHNKATCVDEGSQTCLHGLVILQCRFLCCPAIATIDASSLKQAKFKEGPDGIESIPAEAGNSNVLAHEVSHATSSFHHATTARNNNESLQTLPEVQLCKSGKDSLCSRHGVEFKICIAKQHFEEMRTPEFLNAVSEHHHFVDRKVKDVTIVRCIGGLQQTSALSRVPAIRSSFLLLFGTRHSNGMSKSKREAILLV